MTKRVSIVSVWLIIFGCLLSSAGTVHSKIRHHQWTEQLNRHVEDGRVDYHGFKRDEAVLDNYLSELAAIDPESLNKNDQLAFYINAYNAYTIKLILNHFENDRPPESIRKIGGLFKSPWAIRFASLSGETVSLDTIEHDIIREKFAEPRIHFAVNCASLSCPKLISEAYEGDTLDQQLERSTQAFLEDPVHNYLQEDRFHISSIFKWYKEDFREGPVSFFIAHVTGDLKASLIVAGDRVRVRYVDYDWALNDDQD